MAVGPRTVATLFEGAVEASPDRAMLRCKIGDRWQVTTLGQWHEIAQAWARGLCALGVRAGDRVAIAGETSREWCFADMAVALAGGVTVPIYPSAVADDAAFVAGHSGAVVALVQDAVQATKLVAHRDLMPDLRAVVVWGDANAGGMPAPLPDGWLSDVADLTRRGAAVAIAELRSQRATVQPSDPCTIVYTSGTTGRPKGVVLSHRAFVFEVDACAGALDVRSDDRVFLFLPLAHSFAKMVYVVCMALRTEMAIPASLATLIRDLPEAEATVMPSVPRVFEKVHTKIIAGVAAAGPVRQRIFHAALKIGRRVARAELDGKAVDPLLRLQHEVARRAVFSKVHRGFGGRMRAFISGGAPLSPDLADFFFAVGLPIYEGYGMTENCAAATVNRPGACKLGTVGRPIAGVELRVAGDGEVLLRGGNLMDGYYGDADGTAAAIDSDGWLHTGDIGEVDADGFLRITDRKKDLIITAGGKNIAPQNVEARFMTSPYLSGCMVYGDRRKFLTMLVTLDHDALAAWARDHGLAALGFSALVHRPEVYRLVEREVDAINRSLASYETVKKFAILERDFSIEAGDLTPSLKLRRREVTRKHQGLLDSFYSEHY